jgi:hypothetical protein
MCCLKSVLISIFACFFFINLVKVGYFEYKKRWRQSTSQIDILVSHLLLAIVIRLYFPCLSFCKVLVLDYNGYAFAMCR